MELFREDGCMTDAGFRAMMDGRLDELADWKPPNTSPIVTSAWTDTRPFLTADALETPPRSVRAR